jgi:hypothetical protein
LRPSRPNPEWGGSTPKQLLCTRVVLDPLYYKTDLGLGRRKVGAEAGGMSLGRPAMLVGQPPTTG